MSRKCVLAIATMALASGCAANSADSNPSGAAPTPPQIAASGPASHFLVVSMISSAQRRMSVLPLDQTTCESERQRYAVATGPVRVTGNCISINDVSCRYLAQNAFDMDTNSKRTLLRSCQGV